MCARIKPFSSFRDVGLWRPQPRVLQKQSQGPGGVANISRLLDGEPCTGVSASQLLVWRSCPHPRSGGAEKSAPASQADLSSLL